MTTFFDAFISYGRADSKAFAQKLQARLAEQGFKVWFDFNDIPLAVDFQNQIDDGIEKASHFLFVIAPHAVNSPYCLKEIKLAIKLNKRIIPLLHVMQISRETWQERNPHGTSAEWEAYQAKGLHESYQNMHPTIRKLNWVYFQENQDDFEKSLADLVKLLRTHSEYVEQHTQLLLQALAWERNQKQTSYLLVGEEKQKAETWLKIRFKNEQPPCLPTDLHCEFITESVKNGNNLMTQAIISYADEDRAYMEKIRRCLRRESITVWTNTTDIQTGEGFAEAIKRGIEQADNLIYLLSPDSIKSDFTRQELDYAVSLNKRIIPVLVRETPSQLSPEALRDLQYINITDSIQQDDTLFDDSQLLRILHQDAAYYNEHKVLLTKALKWRQQHDNPSILLRGYNLRSAEAWLKVAKTRTQQPPTALQAEFITESLRQPPLENLDVFISYSRADADLARKLNDALQMQGKTTWFDQESIASGTDFQQEIHRGIKACDNFLFILSPRSVASPYCTDEVEYAAQLNKRFVTVLHRPVNTADLPPELEKVQWLDFNQNQRDFNANFNQLVRTLDTDREYIRSHSKWSQRAIEWQQKEKSADLLLRGSEFSIVQNWLERAEQEKKKPGVTGLQKEFIEASQKAITAVAEQEKHRQAEMLRLQKERTQEAEARLAEKTQSAKRQKLFLAAVSAALVAAIGVSIVAFKQWQRAATVSEGQIKALSRFSLVLAQSDQKFDALLEGIRAGGLLKNLRTETLELQVPIVTALQAAVEGEKYKERNRLIGHQGWVNRIAFSPDGQTLASASDDNTIKLWNLRGEELHSLTGHQDEVNRIVFSPDGQVLASASKDGTIKLWNLQGQELHSLAAHQDAVSSIIFSPDGQTLAS
ncbi:MAG: TIR domain-containing protein, partial [Jaaginema sp. PMC 1079.18]|nr:TIR domain-containing protein [Jaaginema sp. PMC 1079.18]MEC4865433.1 TIR domain-containing protein [Jaaginema sp. PMC 1078.18]